MPTATPIAVDDGDLSQIQFNADGLVPAIVQDARSMWDPVADLDAAAALGDALRDVGYDADAVEDHLGDEGLAADLAESAVYAQRLPDDDIGNAIRFLLLNRPAPVRALPAVDELIITDAVPDLARRVGERLGVRVAPRFADVLTAGVDGIVIAASTATHPDLIRACALAGIPTFCEKPVATLEIFHGPVPTRLPLQVSCPTLSSCFFSRARWIRRFNSS